jgi:hypothetical protein
MLKYLFIFFLLLPIISLSQISGNQRLAGMTSQTFATQDSFLLFIPGDSISRPKQFHPFVIYLHGQGPSSGDTWNVASDSNTPPWYVDQRNSRRASLSAVGAIDGQRYSYILLSPHHNNFDGNNSWGTWQIDDMIYYIKHNLYNMGDTNKIIVTGWSLGGGGVVNYVTSSASRVRQVSYAFSVSILAEWNTGSGCAALAGGLNIRSMHSQDDSNLQTSAGNTQNFRDFVNGCPVVPPIKVIFPKTGNHSGAVAKAYDSTHISFNVDSSAGWAPGGSGNNVSYTYNPTFWEIASQFTATGAAPDQHNLWRRKHKTTFKN